LKVLLYRASAWLGSLKESGFDLISTAEGSILYLELFWPLTFGSFLPGLLELAVREEGLGDRKWESGPGPGKEGSLLLQTSSRLCKEGQRLSPGGFKFEVQQLIMKHHSLFLFQKTPQRVFGIPRLSVDDG